MYLHACISISSVLIQNVFKRARREDLSVGDLKPYRMILYLEEMLPYNE